MTDFPATPLPLLTHEESKSYMAAPLLPDPGCEVVRQHLRTISDLRTQLVQEQQHHEVQHRSLRIDLRLALERLDRLIPEEAPS